MSEFIDTATIKVNFIAGEVNIDTSALERAARSSERLAAAERARASAGRQSGAVAAEAARQEEEALRRIAAAKEREWARMDAASIQAATKFQKGMLGMLNSLVMLSSVGGASLEEIANKLLILNGAFGLWKNAKLLADALKGGIMEVAAGLDLMVASIAAHPMVAFFMAASAAALYLYSQVKKVHEEAKQFAAAFVSFEFKMHGVYMRGAGGLGAQEKAGAYKGIAAWSMEEANSQQAEFNRSQSRARRIEWWTAGLFTAKGSREESLEALRNRGQFLDNAASAIEHARGAASGYYDSQIRDAEKLRETVEKTYRSEESRLRSLRSQKSSLADQTKELKDQQMLMRGERGRMSEGEQARLNDLYHRALRGENLSRGQANQLADGLSRFGQGLAAANLLASRDKLGDEFGRGLPGYRDKLSEAEDKLAKVADKLDKLLEKHEDTEKLLKEKDDAIKALEKAKVDALKELDSMFMEMLKLIERNNEQIRDLEAAAK